MGSDQRRPSWEGLVIEVVFCLAWRWPMGAATWVGRQVFDRPRSAALAALPPLLLVVAIGLLTVGIRERLWGEPVLAAWSSEELARGNVEALRRELDQRERAVPLVRGQARWREEKAELRRRLSSDEALIPSWFWPLPPAQQLPPPWWFFYATHHFLFRSVFALLIALYLLFGVAAAWKGSRRWWARRWRRAIAAGEAEKLLLGLDENGQAHYLSQEERNRHLLVTGTTGSGKTEALKLLTRHDIASGRGLVFIDMKGDRGLAEALFASCASAGRRDDFLFFTLEAAPSHRYNPLASGDALAKRDRLISACTWSDELFYKNEAKAAAGRVLTALTAKGPITVDELYRVFDERGTYADVARWAAPEDRAKFAADLQSWPVFWRNLSGLRANLHEFQQLGDRLCVAHGDIDFREVHERNRVVYFELNSQMRSEVTSSLARLVLEDLKHLSGSLAAGPAHLRKPFSIYIDEARNAVYEGFVGFVSQCRSAGIGLVLATQSPLDFDGAGGPITLSVTQNTATKLVFCQRDPASAEFCAEVGGTRDTVKKTAQMVDDGLLFGPAPTGVYSAREVKEFVVHPETIKTLGLGRAYLIQSDGTRALIRVRHEPNQSSIALAPAMSRKWSVGDPERLGLKGSVVGLAEMPAGSRPPSAKKLEAPADP